MPMTLLEHLAHVDLPLKVSDGGQISNLRVLVRPGHVYANVPLPCCGLDRNWRQEYATVYRITPLGYKVLRYFAATDDAEGFIKDRSS